MNPPGFNYLPTLSRCGTSRIRTESSLTPSITYKCHPDATTCNLLQSETPEGLVETSYEMIVIVTIALMNGELDCRVDAYFATDELVTFYFFSRLVLCRSSLDVMTVRSVCHYILLEYEVFLRF